MEITLCYEKYGNRATCAINMTFLFLCFAMFILNSYAGYVMSKSLKAVKFENLVIFCGILQSLILIFILLTGLEFMTFLILFCQTLIYLFILRRFLRIYFRMKRTSNESRTNCYNQFFYVNALINVGITLSDFVMVLMFPNEKSAIIIQWVHSIFCFGISLIMCYIGINVRRLLFKTAEETDDNSFANYIEENLKKEDVLTKTLISQQDIRLRNHFEFKETYFKVRRLQIDLIIYISLLSGAYQATYVFLKTTLLYEQFDNSGIKSIPITTLTYIMQIVYLSCSLSTIILNFFAFFYIIRSSYQSDPIISKRSSLNYFSNESFVRISKSSKNNEIDKFID